MAVFKNESQEFQRLDWHLLQNSSIHLYHRSDYLAEDVDWLQTHGYQIDIFDCTNWLDEASMLRDFERVLTLPDYYGNNLDALNDCLSDLEIPESGGRALIFHRYNCFATPLPETAWIVLDILADTARFFLLFGWRLLVLVQSDDPSLSFQPVGGRAVWWNRKERLNKSRGL